MPNVIPSNKDVGESLGRMMYDWQKGVKPGESSIYIIKFSDEFKGGYALTDGHILLRMVEETAQFAREKFESYKKIQQPEPDIEIKDLKVNQGFKYQPTFDGLTFSEKMVGINVFDLLPDDIYFEKDKDDFSGHLLNPLNYSIAIEGSSDAQIYGSFDGKIDMDNFDYFTFIAKKYLKYKAIKEIKQTRLEWLAQRDKDDVIVLCGSQVPGTWAGMLMTISSDTITNKMDWLKRIDYETVEV